MKRLALIIVLLAAGSAHGAQLQLLISPRIDYRLAQFVWTAEGDDPAAVGFVVLCGNAPGNYFLQSEVVPLETEQLPVSDVVKGNGVFYCIAAMTDLQNVLWASNEVTLEHRGKWVTLLSE